MSEIEITPVDYQGVKELDLTKIPFSYLELDPQEQFSGIYACLCSVNYKFYLGSTKDFYPTKTYKGRKADHLNALRNRDHYNIIFRRAFIKYGESNFHWFKLEGEVDRDDLLDREDFYLAKYRPFDRNIGFNINETATGGNPNFKPILSSYKFVRFSGEIVEGENLTKFARDNNIWARYLFDLQTGKRDYCEDLINFKNLHRLEEIREKAKKKELSKTYYKLISPTGEIVEGFDRVEFCQKYKLRPRFLWDIISGRSDTIFGWRLFVPGKHPDRNLTQEELKDLKDELSRKRKAYVKVSELRFNGEKIKIPNIRKYCRDNKLSSSSMFKIVNGERNTEYCGYTSLDEETHRKQLRNSTKAILINSIGEFTRLRSTVGFCRKSGIKATDVRYYSLMNKFLKGYYFVLKTQGLTEEQEKTLLEEKKTKLFPNKPGLFLKEVNVEQFLTVHP